MLEGGFDESWANRGEVKGCGHMRWLRHDFKYAGVFGVIYVKKIF